MKVGDYVRTKNGYIDKIKDRVVEEHIRGEDKEEKPYDLFQLGREYYDEEFDEYSEWVFEDFIAESSPNINNLIDIGDYINGSKLLSIDYAEDKYGNCDKLHFYYSFEDDEKDVNEYYEELKIKSIVTHEQFENMEYKIGE